MLIRRLLRYLYLAGFFVVLPALGAALLVWMLSPRELVASGGVVGLVSSTVRDQRIPIGIVLFTVIELGLWWQRFRLPGSSIIAVGGRTDIPASARQNFDMASALLEEAERILNRHHRKIDEQQGGARADVEKALDALRHTMDADPFQERPFGEAYERALSMVHSVLGPWRKSEAREVFDNVSVAVLIAIALRLFVFEAFKIPSGSMIPTLQISDHIFVNKLVYGPTLPFMHTRLFPRLPPKRSDVIVFEYPENREQDFIKRVIALPGDRLEARDSHPWINGWKVPWCKVGTYAYIDAETGASHKGELDLEYLESRSYLTLYERTYVSSFTEVQGPYHAKPGEVWVMGDNRNNSHDSRGWFEGKGGGVPFENIKGRAWFVWLSWANGGSFAFDRVGVSVLGAPELPPSQRPLLQAGLDSCLASRPPLTATTPPNP